MTMKTPAEIATETMAGEYGPGTMWEETNEWGEQGFSRAQAESDVLEIDIRHLIERAVEADRKQREQRGHGIEVIRALNDFYPAGAPHNPEYLRGQVELLAALTSAGDMDTAVADVTAEISRYLDEKVSE